MKIRRRLDIHVHLALIFVQITFGAFGVFGKYVMTSVQPLSLAGMRVLFAGPLLFLFAWKMERTVPDRREWPMLALLGFLGVFMNQIMYIVGLNYTTAINATILMPSIPVLAVVAASLLGSETFSRRKGIGILLSVLGAVTILDVSSFSFRHGTAFGNLLVLLNCVSYAFFLVLAKPVLRRLSPLTVIAWAFLFGGSAVFLVSAPAFFSTPFSSLSTDVWICIAYILLLPTLVNYILNTWAIQRSSSSLVATYTTLQPVVATILASALLQEQIGIRQVVGFICIIAGLLISSRS